MTTPATAHADPEDSSNSNRKNPLAGQQPIGDRDAGLDYLYGRLNYERVSHPVHQGAFRLRRMRHLLREMDHPERATQIVHVGGTKGKGSTSSMLAAMLASGPRTVGLYTSPHLERLEERFCVGGQPCSEQELIELVQAVRVAADAVEASGEGPATFFELTTAMALEYFRRRGCEVSIIEVGLGGRLDSTNVCDPLVSVLTTVGLDHQHLLGETIEKIAAEKAGIIKPGVPVITGVEASGGGLEVIRRTAKDRGAPLWALGRDFDLRLHPGEAGELGSRIDFLPHAPGLRAREGWQVGLEGAHQARNAALALAVLDALEPLGIGVPLERQRAALAEVRCSARVERFAGTPEIILDAAHNVDSIRALRAVLLNRPVPGKTIVVFGTSADKDADEMLAMLCSAADIFVLTRYWSNPRWFDPTALAGFVRDKQTMIQERPSEALDIALRSAGQDGRVVICGSFFLAAELRPILRARLP